VVGNLTIFVDVILIILIVNLYLLIKTPAKTGVFIKLIF